MMLHPDQLVRLRLPGEISHFCAANGEWYDVEIDDVGRFVMIEARLAHAMLDVGRPSGWQLREANAELAAALGPLKPEQSINLRAFEEAQRQALAPPSRNEIAAETLAMYQRTMR